MRRIIVVPPGMIMALVAIMLGAASPSGATPVSAPVALTVIPVITSYFDGDSCGGSVLSNPQDSPHARVVRATVNDVSVPRDDLYNFPAYAGNKVIVVNQADSGYGFRVDGVVVTRTPVKVKGIPATRDPQCDNVAPNTRPINLTVKRGSTTFVDVFNPSNPYVTDPDGDPTKLIQVLNDTTYGTVSIVRHDFGDGQSRQAIKYVAKTKGKDVGSYLVQDTFQLDGQTTHHLVPDDMTFTVS